MNTMPPTLPAGERVGTAARELGLDVANPDELTEPEGPDLRIEVDAAGISSEPIVTRLMILPIQDSEARLVRNFQFHTLAHAWDLTVDTESGEILTRFDWVAADR